MQINSNNSISQNVYNTANKTLNNIATGTSVNQSSEHASSLAIANKLLAQANGFSQAIENTNSGIALTQIAQGATNEQSDILDKVKEKLSQASTATTSQDGRDALLKDIKGLIDQFDQIASSTKYSGNTLLQNSPNDPNVSQSLQFQAGIKTPSLIEANGVQSNSLGLGLDALKNQDPATFSADDARNFLDDVDNALNGLNDIRSEFGSTQNQLESSTKNLISQRNTTLQARSVYDTDYAKESATFSKQNILAQIGAFSAAQSNNIDQQSVTRLLS